jgi:hypothetical protein
MDQPQLPPPPMIVAPPGTTTLVAPATQAAATATATAVAVPGTLAAPRGEVLAIPDAGQQAPPDSSSPGPTSRGNGYAGLTGRLARLRIGSHTLSRAALAQVKVGSAGSGLILGVDRNQGPVLVRFFRPEPTRIVLVGGAWAGQFVAFRALALGARIAVVTDDPQMWHGFGERSTGRSDRVAVLTDDRGLTVPATMQQPALVIYDLGVTTAAGATPLGPWQTQLIILRHLEESGVSSIQDCDLVLMQRLGGPEATLVGSVLRLPAPSTQFLQVMADDMVAVVGEGTNRYVWLSPTDIERQHAGAPHR